MPVSIPRSPSYLVKHRHMFYFRVSVPVDLRPVLGKIEYRYSLRTSYLRTARQKAMKMGSTAKTIFTGLRQCGGLMSKLTDQQIKEWVDAELRKNLQEAEEEILMRDKPRDDDDIYDFIDNYETAKTECQEALWESRWDFTAHAVGEILKDRGIELDKDSSGNDETKPRLRWELSMEITRIG